MTAPEKMSSKRRKTTTVSVDRISNLPDCILSNILSSLDTKYAVQSSVLSKRWKNLWTSLVNLNLDSNLFKSLINFHKFVRKVVRRRDRTIKIRKQGRLNTLILEAIAHYASSPNVQHLNVTLKSKIRNTFPPFPISSDSLRSLNLKILGAGTGRSHRVPETSMRKSYFKQLVSLHLEYIELVDADPFSGCPNLKDLVLINCVYYLIHSRADPIELTIIAPKLTSLILVFDNRCLSPAEIVVSTPELRSLEVKRHSVIQKTKGHSFLSVKASRGLLLLDSVTLDVIDSSDNLINLLKRVGNARSVALSSSMAERLSGAAPDKLAEYRSPLTNLKTLKFIRFSRDKPLKVPAIVLTYLLRKTSCENVVMEVPRYKNRRD